MQITFTLLYMPQLLNFWSKSFTTGTRWAVKWSMMRSSWVCPYLVLFPKLSFAIRKWTIEKVKTVGSKNHSRHGAATPVVHNWQLSTKLGSLENTLRAPELLMRKQCFKCKWLWLQIIKLFDVRSDLSRRGIRYTSIATFCVLTETSFALNWFVGTKNYVIATSTEHLKYVAARKICIRFWLSFVQTGLYCIPFKPIFSLESNNVILTTVREATTQL